ncbi:hypothetical protein FF2_008947 [Malus domestica]
MLRLLLLSRHHSQAVDDDHLHLLCDQDSVSLREDDNELEEEEIVDDQDSVSSKPLKGIALQSHTLEHSWTFWSSGIILFGW